MSNEYFDTTAVDGKAVVYLKQPPHNFLNQKMCEELINILSEIPTNLFDGLIITAKGKHFCAGVEVEEHLPGKVESMLPVFNELMLKLADFPLPTVAIIFGSCIGGGLELARACRSVWFLSNSARKLHLGLPGITRACFPPYAVVDFPLLLLRKRVPPEQRSLIKMIQFILTGQTNKYLEINDMILLFKLGLIDRMYDGSLDQAIESIDMVEVDKILPLSHYRDKLLNESLFSDTLFDQAMWGQEALEEIDPKVLEITIQAIQACGKEKTTSSAMKVSETIYLQKIVSLPVYTERLHRFLASQSK